MAGSSPVPRRRAAIEEAAGAGLPVKCWWLERTDIPRLDVVTDGRCTTGGAVAGSGNHGVTSWILRRAVEARIARADVLYGATDPPGVTA